MIKISVQLSEGIRVVIEGKQSNFVVESPEPVTIRQIAHDNGIPTILIAFAIVDGVKRNLDDVVRIDSKIHFFGTLAGG